jgi:hypothetical protein
VTSFTLIQTRMEETVLEGLQPEDISSGATGGPFFVPSCEESNAYVMALPSRTKDSHPHKNLAVPHSRSAC